MAITLDGTNGITTPGPSVVEANTSDAALRITQTGSGNALVVEDSANPDASPFVVTSAGDVGIGQATPVEKVQIDGNLLTSNGSNVAATSTSIKTGRRRTSLASVISGDSLGKFVSSGWDGSAYINASSIETFVDGTPGTNDMPGRLVFSTTADGASSPTEQMRITSTGDLRFNSGYGSVATAYGCRAWVNFNGTGTVAIRGDGNVTSITDNGIGNYTVNFTTAMPDTNYCVNMTSGVANVIDANNLPAIPSSTSSIVVRPFDGSSYVDTASVNVVIFR